MARVFCLSNVHSSHFMGLCCGTDKTVMIQDVDQSYEEGTIISAERGAPISIEQLFKDLKTNTHTDITDIHTRSGKYLLNILLFISSTK